MVYRLFCDECNKEIIDHNYVEQRIIVHNKAGEDITAYYCSNCWDNFEIEFKKNFTKIFEDK